MNGRPALSELSAFAAVAQHRSFRKAADELGLAPSTLSHMMRSLEARMGVRLLHRTTRSVAPTEAGERLLARLHPILHALDEALDEVNTFREAPSGALRINASEVAVQVLLQSIVPAFVVRYPHVTLDLVTEGRLVDIVAEGFDAGIRLGESMPQDMVAVAITGATRFVTVAAPAYLAARGTPRLPEELHAHLCIRHRLPSGKPYRWEFENSGQEIRMDVQGAITLDHPGLMVQAASAGLGIAYVPLDVARIALGAGQLVTVLDDWCPAIPGLFLYYPGHRHVPAGLRALVQVIREQH
jgi:DNA-binding transcriptional LysR family regulator